MVERDCPPFTMNDSHNLLKFKSLPYLSPPFKEIIGPLMKPGCPRLLAYMLLNQRCQQENRLLIPQWIQRLVLAGKCPASPAL
jgi:hypothetical protein